MLCYQYSRISILYGTAALLVKEEAGRQKRATEGTQKRLTEIKWTRWHIFSQSSIKDYKIPNAKPKMTETD
jgi:hypothetical protein